MSQAEFESSITHFIDAPREAVWRAFTDHMEEWWCPRPWTTRIIERDLRSGGSSVIEMRGPNGEGADCPMAGVFLEVVPAERVVFTDAFTAGWVPQSPFMVGIMTFADEGAGTRYTGTARCWTEEAHPEPYQHRREHCHRRDRRDHDGQRQRRRNRGPNRGGHEEESHRATGK